MNQEQNIHIPKGMSLENYVWDILNNAYDNGNDEFLYSLEVRDAEWIMRDMATCDAGIERHLEIHGFSEEEQKKIITHIKDYMDTHHGPKD